MKKEKMYNPEKTGSFEMMFGFKQPYVYSYVRVVRQPRKYTQQSAETSGGMILNKLKELENEN